MVNDGANNCNNDCANGRVISCSVAVQPAIGYSALMQNNGQNNGYTVCGIDFGTSNSTVAVVRGGETTLVPVEDAHTTIPSAIFYPGTGSLPLYGRQAVRAYTEREPGRLMRSLKSILGSELIAEKTAVGGQYRSFESILVGFLAHLKSKAEAFAGTSIDAVVMGRPVHFVDDNDAVDARAEAKLADIARAAGFKTVSFQFEPIAAALAFEHTLARDELVFISDIGGGTADFSIVTVGPERRSRTDRSKDILASDGIRVGGTNLDMKLSMAAVMPHLGSRSKTKTGLELPRWPFVDLATWHRIHTIATSKNMNTLRQILADCAEPGVFERYIEVIKGQNGHLIAARVEQAKIDLSENDAVDIDLNDTMRGLATTTDRPGFEQAIATELQRLKKAVAATLALSGRSGDEITTVFLTGGTSAVPAVKKVLAGVFANAQTIEGDLFNSVGFGLALEAKRRHPEPGKIMKAGGKAKV